MSADISVVVSRQINHPFLNGFISCNMTPSPFFWVLPPSPARTTPSTIRLAPFKPFRKECFPVYLTLPVSFFYLPGLLSRLVATFSVVLCSFQLFPSFVDGPFFPRSTPFSSAPFGGVLEVSALHFMFLVSLVPWIPLNGFRFFSQFSDFPFFLFAIALRVLHEYKRPSSGPGPLFPEASRSLRR